MDQKLPTHPGEVSKGITREILIAIRLEGGFRVISEGEKARST